MAPASIRSRQPSGEYSLWPAQTGMPPRARTSRMSRASLAQRHGSSNQRMSSVAHPLAQVEAHAASDVALVGVDRDHEVVTGRVAARLDARSASTAGGLRAELELAAAEAHLEPLGDLARGSRSATVAVVAADDVDREAVAVAAPELGERASERLADRVPDGGVDAGERDQPDAAIAQLVERHRVAELPAALDCERVLADQARLDLGADDLDDLGERRVLVGGVGLCRSTPSSVWTRVRIGAALASSSSSCPGRRGRAARRAGSARCAGWSGCPSRQRPIR